jgi:hypothetical protein
MSEIWLAAVLLEATTATEDEEEEEEEEEEGIWFEQCQRQASCRLSSAQIVLPKWSCQGWETISVPPQRDVGPQRSTYHARDLMR